MPRPRERPDVVVVTIDTLRADHVSFLGYEKKTTPFLDQVAAESVVFANAYSPSSWTLPSIVSLLTSWYPIRHGMNQGLQRRDGRVLQHTVPASYEMWPEILKKHGYGTFGVTSNAHLREDLGFQQGFDRYTCGTALTATGVNGIVRSYRRDLRRGPYFLWVHYMDPHFPYIPRNPWPDPDLESLETMRQRFGDVRQHDILAAVGPADRDSALATIEAAYDSEIHFVDQALRALASFLPRIEDALVIVASDHGEEFLDHGGTGHASSLFEELIRIPMILRLPRGEGAGRVIRSPVSLVDLLPTVVSYLGIDVPMDLQGSSLLPLLEEDSQAERPLIAELSYIPRRPRRSLRVGRWKLIENISTGERFLFDLDEDPGETRDLHAERESVTAELARRLEQWVDQHDDEAPDFEEVPVSEEVRRRLEALGYK